MMTIPNEHGKEVLALANLLHLSRRARQAQDANELIYVAVNETHLLAPYRQAVLWLDERVTALSGVVSPDTNVPYVQWLQRLVGEILTLPPGEDAAALVVDPEMISADVRNEWDEWLPAHALWLKLPAVGDHFHGGGCLLVRDETWNEDEQQLLCEWAEVWANAWALLRKPVLDGVRDALRRLLPGRDDWLAWGAVVRQPRSWPDAVRRAWSFRRFRWGLAVLAILFFPVRLSVLAPGELVPAHPAVIRAPLDGVIERIAVEPNQSVKAGDVLFEFDPSILASRLAVAEQAFATADAEYRQHAQQALSDDKMKARLVVSLGTMQEKKTEVDFLRALHGRATVVAPQEGMAIFDDPTEWAGRPVSTGEKVMLVAAPDVVEIEAWLSLADAIDLDPGASVTLYLNTRPFAPVSGQMRYLAHEAQQRPDGHYAYRLRATIPSGGPHGRSGLKGTAKVAGGWVPAVYWVLRKPVAALRNLIGL